MAKLSRRSIASNTASSSLSSSSSFSRSNSDVNKIEYSNNHKSNTSSFYRIQTETNTKDNVNDSSLLADPLRAGTTIRSTSLNNISNSGKNTTLLSTARPTTVNPVPPSSISFQNRTTTTTAAEILAAERERIRMEFFATYDVMTGVRIAATLGGFFGLMVFLIVWKSRSSSNETLRVLKDPKIAAVAAACMQEEEDRKIHEAMLATGMSIYPDEYDTILYRRQRMLSLGNVSAPPVLHRGYRFSSVEGGGYSSLLEPPRRRYSYSNCGGSSSGSGRRKSCSESSRILSNYAMGNSFGTDDYFIETEDELDGGREYDNFIQGGGGPNERKDSTKQYHGFLEVPLTTQDSRRSSAMTCCSTESSYLERRCSAITLGLGDNLPESLRRKLSAVSNSSSTDMWDYYYPDIQVIHPTPKVSPCPSELSFYDQQRRSESKPSKTVKRTAANNNSNENKNNKALYSSSIVSREFTRKQSIACYDPESAQYGGKQQIHSISADTVDLFPHDQQFINESKQRDPFKLMQHFSVSTSDQPLGTPRVDINNSVPITDELRLNVQRTKYTLEMSSPSAVAPNVLESLTCNSSLATITATTTNSNATVAGGTTAGDFGTSSLSIDSTADACAVIPSSITGKRAPLASLSSFKISSIDCQDSEMRSLDEDSVFLDSVADTDEDMEQFSTDSEDVSLGASNGGDKGTKPDIMLSSAYGIDSKINKIIPLQHPDVQRLSLTGNVTSSTSRPRRPMLERHRTISVSSSDCISLIGHQMKDFPITNYICTNEKYQPQQQIQKQQPSPPPPPAQKSNSLAPLSPHPKRPPLQQQISDQSLPTTTEDDTCSTLNTEVLAATRATTLDANERIVSLSSLSNIIIRSSPLLPESSISSCDKQSINLKEALTKRKTKTKHKHRHSSSKTKFIVDPTRSSISDSVTIAVREPLICVPSSLKNLIRGSANITGGSAASTSAIITTSKSATNLSLFGDDCNDNENDQCRSVILDLPLIKLPDNESSDTEVSEEKSNSEENSRDLPSSSHKWSRETLF